MSTSLSPPLRPPHPAFVCSIIPHSNTYIRISAVIHHAFSFESVLDNATLPLCAPLQLPSCRLLIAYAGCCCCSPLAVAPVSAWERQPSGRSARRGSSGDTLPVRPSHTHTHTQGPPPNRLSHSAQGRQVLQAGHTLLPVLPSSHPATFFSFSPSSLPSSTVTCRGSPPISGAEGGSRQATPFPFTHQASISSHRRPSFQPDSQSWQCLLRT